LNFNHENITNFKFGSPRIYLISEKSAALINPFAEPRFTRAQPPFLTTGRSYSPDPSTRQWSHPRMPKIRPHITALAEPRRTVVPSEAEQQRAFFRIPILFFSFIHFYLEWSPGSKQPTPFSLPSTTAFGPEPARGWCLFFLFSIFG
jgi:hypothetical protein